MLYLHGVFCIKWGLIVENELEGRMEKIFISNLKINKVRHLKEIEIPLSKDCMKHLIVTGKNGSGKTSLLDAVSVFLYAVTDEVEASENDKALIKEKDDYLVLSPERQTMAEPFSRMQKRLAAYFNRLSPLSCEMNQPLENLSSMFRCGDFVAAYYRADRTFNAQIPKHVEKVEIKDSYKITDTPREEFVKYLLDLKMTEALAVASGKSEKAEKIKIWYKNFQNLLRRIFEDESLTLMFDEETFKFSICIDGREPFDFNTLSSGYAAVLDIVVDLIMRMEKRSDRTFHFEIPGIVLIDEIETHLHLELQKKILSLLTTIFPNIQFIVSTHSPFILNSLENVVIYDLENHVLVQNGLADVPYGGIVEGYFNTNEMSFVLEKKFERYKELVNKPDLTDADFEEIADLEMYLNEIPDYLALNITTEYQRLKLAFENREDI